MGNQINKDKAKAYVNEYITNGFNKTGALDKINPKASYKSNNQHSTEFHNKVINGDAGQELKDYLRSVYSNEEIKEVVERLKNSKDWRANYAFLQFLEEIMGLAAPKKTEVTETLILTGQDEIKIREEVRKERNRLGNIPEGASN